MHFTQRDTWADTQVCPYIKRKKQMIKKTHAIPRSWAKSILSGDDQPAKLTLDTPWALISIHGSDESRLKDEIEDLRPPENMLDSLFICFDDVIPLYGEVDENFTYFNRDMARRIISFLKAVEDKVEVVVVNCNAGVSRSGAVCVFIVEEYGLDRGLFFREHPQVMGNALVLEVLSAG